MTTKQTPRAADVVRETRETKIRLTLKLDGSGQTEIYTGLGFFDHMLTVLAYHARWDLRLKADGDTHIDDHHTIEDCGLAIGVAVDQALGDRRGIQRFGHAYAPLDEALARCVIDLSGRPGATIDLGLRRERLGDVACENLGHFFRSMATTGRMTLHVDVLRGENDHHRAEAAFKAAALAIRESTRQDNGDHVPSTKGTL